MRIRSIFNLLLTVCIVTSVAVSCGDKAPQVPETLTVSPTGLSFGSEDASTRLFSIKTTADWTAVTSVDWIIIDKKSGSGNASISVKVKPNGEGDRQGVVTISGAQTATVTVSQTGSHITTLVAAPAPFDGNKRASTTYQLLIYSFADSDGDGIGDFKGIENKLDYLDEIGATALWLSPAHPTNSYHAYDVNDYGKLNPKYGTEDDFKSLIDAAHAKGIKIYMDYVLNHSGSGNDWFKSVKADPANSPYRDYYVLSKNPDADVAAGLVDNYGGAKTPGMGSWHSLGDGEIGFNGVIHFRLDWNNKTVTVTKGDVEDVREPEGDAGFWIYYGNGKTVRLEKTSEGIFEITANISTDWGFLIRTSLSTWENGTKYGAKAGGSIVTLGEPLQITNSSPVDIVFGSTTYYFASFAESMPDLNYGKAETASESPAFKAIAATADKWITDFGIDGFRLDAVTWLYQEQIRPNQDFLKQWYDHCNATYKAAGHSDDIFMVGEAWASGGHPNEMMYYKGLISCFEFDYFGKLSSAVNGSPSSYVPSVMGFIADHKSQREDAITSIFMSNHDQDRAAESFGRNLAKEKQAAAMMLTTPGKPFIYQGEELGYWGTKGSGDVYVRTPMMWDKAGNDCAKKGVENNVTSGLLTAAVSVEAQSADESSLLNVYRSFSRLRNTYQALASGEMSATDISGATVASWYMTASDGQELLVIHNVATSEKTIEVSDDMSKPVGILGTASIKDAKLILGANSSAVFQLK